MFYELLKGLHNILRWVVIMGGLYAIATSIHGLYRYRIWTNNDRVAGIIFTSSLNTQLVIGIVLFLVSPFIRGLLNVDDVNPIKEATSRFFVVEHWAVMILAIIAAQLGYSLAIRARDNRTKFLYSTSGYVLAALLIAYGIPWWRPLLPGL
jgi:hypothetical protein